MAANLETAGLAVLVPGTCIGPQGLVQEPVQRCAKKRVCQPETL